MIFIILYKVLVVILIKDLEGLEKYYRQLLQDCNRVNNLTALSPTVINNPAIYNVVAAKYHRADEKWYSN